MLLYNSKIIPLSWGGGAEFSQLLCLNAVLIIIVKGIAQGDCVYLDTVEEFDVLLLTAGLQAQLPPGVHGRH